MKIISKAMLVAIVACCSVATVTAQAKSDRAWQFRVLLDGKPIGTHSFRLEGEGERRLLQSEADFRVKFLFFTAYDYKHRNTETWSGGCLREIESRTVTNGKEQMVTGEQAGESFVVEETQQGASELPSCVMSFAYWNPAFLEQPRLLNPQTGEYLDVNVEALGADTVAVRGEEKPAQRYRITAKNTDLEVWYSADDEWLGLESVAKGGRKIRYELI